ncbi:predicted protein [Uncinocarpus reesii 1704]|uniref:Uncharacterized protein n=1 Tax=Uncinocarpus reesii (strain UAMH 1704) TaxID=336963 RepID=C4JEC1_UNCRE|nr:uncharacterized protein UREG_00737 [Uncinocarpus reesii 1704]EEP75890.1 predicted protein [Uncinocarpus reesii 1704]
MAFCFLRDQPAPEGEGSSITVANRPSYHPGPLSAPRVFWTPVRGRILEARLSSEVVPCATAVPAQDDLTGGMGEGQGRTPVDVRLRST